MYIAYMRHTFEDAQILELGDMFGSKLILLFCEAIIKQRSFCGLNKNITHKYHISFENMIHNSMAREACPIDKELDGKLQPGVHLPPPGLSFAFFSPFL